jgi:tetratricopeptide (TPR) repeat protein
MLKGITAIAVGLAFLCCQAARSTSAAAEDSGVNAGILQLALNWEHIKFEVTDKDLQEKQMAALADRAGSIVQQYPGRPEAAIWQAILISEQASMASENGSPFKALGFAKHAREILEPIAKQNPAVLDAGAPTSLGVLYSRVPGFPIAFGDKAKARTLLQEAIKYAPDGLDANYFYGDFLYEQHEYPEAIKVLEHALAVPAHPERPIWDRSRRLVIKELLAKIQSGAHS